jgi:hypothetical protein
MFSVFVVLSLSTPSWRYGPFSWWPVWTFEELAGGPVELGLFNFLPPLIVAGWLLTREWRKGIEWGRWQVTIPLVALTLWSMVRMDWETARLIFIYVGAYLLAWMVYLYVLDQKPPLAPALVAVIVIQAVVAIGQFYTQRDLGLIAMGELPLHPAHEGVTVLYARDQPWLRAYGLTAHPNLLGAILTALLVLLLPSWRSARTWQKVILLTAILLGLAGLFFSFSRSAWLAGAVGGFVWVALQWRGKVRRPTARQLVALLVPVLLVVLFLFVYGDLVLSRFIDLDSPVEARSIEQRLSDARLALDVFARDPWLGAGLGHYVDAASVADSEAARVHNVLLLVAAELGIPGLLIVIALFITPFIGRRKTHRLTRVERQRLWATRLAPWIVMLVVNQFDTTLWITANWQTGIMFGLIAARAAQEVDRTNQDTANQTEEL